MMGYESISDISLLRTEPSSARPASGECLPMYAANGLPLTLPPSEEEKDPERLRPVGAEVDEERYEGREGAPIRVGVLSGEEV